MCNPSLFIWPLCRLIASVVATASLCLSSSTSFRRSVSRFLCSALLWGWYTGGSWVTTKLAPASVMICVTSLCRALTVCLVLPVLRSLVPHRKTTVVSWSLVQLSRAQALASVSVGARWFLIGWFSHIIRCPWMSRQFESPIRMTGGFSSGVWLWSSCRFSILSSLFWSLEISWVFSLATCSRISFSLTAACVVCSSFFFCFVASLILIFRFLFSWMSLSLSFSSWSTLCCREFISDRCSFSRSCIRCIFVFSSAISLDCWSFRPVLWSFSSIWAASMSISASSSVIFFLFFCLSFSRCKITLFWLFCSSCLVCFFSFFSFWWPLCRAA